MRRCFVVACLVLALTLTASAFTRGVKEADQGRYAGPHTFQCRDGSRSLPLSFVNDDYCDCEDGSDEPGTSACPKSTFWCTNKGYKGLSIPASRVNDGICDCCDGSDEYSGIASCSDTCIAQGKEAMKGFLEQLAAFEAGSKIREAWAAEGQEKHAKNVVETANLKASLDEKESLIAEAKELLEKEEAAEKAERQRLEEEREKEVQRIQAEFAAKHPPAAVPAADQQQQPPAAEQSQQTQTPPADAAAPAAGGAESAAPAEEFFPYPKEYAFPQGDAAQANDDNADLDDGPEAVEQHVDDHLDNHLDEPAPPAPATPAPAADQPQLPPPVSFTSESAEAARKALRKLEDDKRDLQKKHDDLKNMLDYDFGPNKELYALSDSCFQYKANQYVYEVCPYNKAEQKENGRGTSLGRFEKYDSAKQVMTFTNGQTCWNGPARSLSVKLECGGENRLLAVEEPGKCVYSTTLQTPALCDASFARTIRTNLEAEFSVPLPPVHNEL